jgi:hypothetical protein
MGEQERNRGFLFIMKRASKTKEKHIGREVIIIITVHSFLCESSDSANVLIIYKHFKLKKIDMIKYCGEKFQKKHAVNRRL